MFFIFLGGFLRSAFAPGIISTLINPVNSLACASGRRETSLETDFSHAYRINSRARRQSLPVSASAITSPPQLTQANEKIIRKNLPTKCSNGGGFGAHPTAE